MTNKLRKNYSLLSLVQYLGSLLVIIIHSGQLINNELIHFITKSLFARLAVPIFIISTAYFYRLNIINKEKKSHYFKALLKQYLFWSLLYLPLGIEYFVSQQFPMKLFPLALILGFIYIGTYYHLWYYPALIFSLLFLDKVLKHFPYKIIFSLFLILYLFGTLETYSSYLQGKWLLGIYYLTHDFFLTYRNGLFYSSIFVLIGFKLASPLENSILIKKRGTLIALAIILYLTEGYLVFINPGFDKNLFLALIPLSFYLMYYVLNSQRLSFSLQVNQGLRYLAKMNYLLHPVIIYILLTIFKKDFFAATGFLLFLLAGGLASLIGFIIFIFVKNPSKNRK